MLAADPARVVADAALAAVLPLDYRLLLLIYIKRISKPMKR